MIKRCVKLMMAGRRGTMFLLAHAQHSNTLRVWLAKVDGGEQKFHCK